MILKVLFFLCFNTLYLTYCDASDSRVPTISTTDANVTNDDVTETQHASCKIVTEELVASARATVTTILTGACNAKTIGNKFQTLEKTLTSELKEIKAMLHALLATKKDSSRLVETFRDDSNIINNHQKDKTKITPSLRQPEIDKFNNTVQQISTANGSIRLFFYYCQIKNFEEKLVSWRTAHSERSATFYVGKNGYAMYIKVTPRYFPDGTVFVAVGLTRSRHDSMLEWPFPYRIRLEILDHSPEESRQDRRSRIWDPSTLCSEYFWGRPKLTGEPDNPECVGLSVPRQVLFSKLPSSNDRFARNTRYLWDGSIIIKLTVYL
ncbi:uncharacterized protein LOC143183712 [Calliopsis andreniformis]|uniref:uncharacterized protein LOC143183712 n=1 Tax=Calliopsis andreniformis TaxID=337506 RepID=UPI003FCC5003